MPSWFVRGLRRGVVTTRYPARAEASAAFLPTPPVFRADHLDTELADRLCIVCPSRALRRQGDVLIFDVGACTACGLCREIAPEAIASSGEFELAATNRAHLIKRIALRRTARP